jgi:hypothetical protein
MLTMGGATQSELRLARLIDERELIRGKHESKLAEIESRDDKTLTNTDSSQLTLYREQATAIDAEVTELYDEIEASTKAFEESKRLRRAMAGTIDGVDVVDDGVVYRSMAAYARDVILTGNGRECGKIAAQVGDPRELDSARERLQLVKRTPANTLTSDIAGLNPAQHISQIFQIIDSSRPLVATAIRATLERGVLTYPQIDTSPSVAVQTTQKTEAGNQGLDVSMVTATASTYLGGGDLSWQAINWSSPNALDLWFQLVAADYALKTEQDAAQALQHSGFSNNISSTISGTPTFAQFMTAVGAGYADVFANSGRVADTVYMAPDRFGYLLGLTSDAFTQFTNVSGTNIGPLNVVVSRGMDSGVVVVGDRSGLLVAETAGAPVELRVVEPAIGGVEVGLIGAFEAVVVDDGAFAMITTAS